MEFNRLRFAAICEEEGKRLEGETGGIGTYREKRLHRILKRFASDDENTHEIPVGKYVADVRNTEGITEIQTKSLRLLLPKLRYYLEETDLPVTVIHPILAEKTLIRMDRETGEVLYRKRSPKKGRAEDLLPELYGLSELLPNPRIRVRVLLIQAEEFRFSERVRYRREGAYDSELFPRALMGEADFCDRASFRRFLPTEGDSFFADEYGAFVKLKKRKLYSALNFLCAIGLLRREKEGKRYRYFVIRDSESDDSARKRK